jgi:hypothetical protein
MEQIKPSENVYYLKATKDFPFTDEDFTKNQFLKKDKEFLKSLLKDDVSSFELVYSEKFNKTKVNSFYSSLRYLPKVTIYKEVGVLKNIITTNHPFENILYTLIPLFSRKNIDSGMTNMEFLSEINDSECNFKYPGIVQTFELQPAKIVKPRKITGMNFIEYEEKTKTFNLFIKPCKIKKLIQMLLITS